MTQKASIAKALLQGRVLSIMDGFKEFLCTNLPREISRSIEAEFNVEVSKSPTKFTSRSGHSGVFFKYRLNRTSYNEEGIKKMIAYVQEQEGTKPPRTNAEEKQKETTEKITQLHQQQLFS